MRQWGSTRSTIVEILWFSQRDALAMEIFDLRQQKFYGFLRVSLGYGMHFSSTIVEILWFSQRLVKKAVCVSIYDSRNSMVLLELGSPGNVIDYLRQQKFYGSLRGSNVAIIVFIYDSRNSMVLLENVPCRKFETASTIVEILWFSQR